MWHGVLNSEDEFSTTHTVEQRVHGNFYDKHAGKGLLMFGLKTEGKDIISPHEIEFE